MFFKILRHGYVERIRPPRASLEAANLLQDDQNLTINGTSVSNQTLYILSATLAGQALIDGKRYYVNVIATDKDGVGVNATSAAVLV